MIRANVLAELRYVLNSSGNETGWGDPTLYGYLGEGQDRFCEYTGFIRDMSNYTITLASGTATYAVDARIIEILSIWDGTRMLTKYLSGETAEGDIADGKPSMWQVDQETGLIKFDRAPSDDEDGDEYFLRVWRYSQTDFAASGELEIPARFHRAPIEWAAYKAFNHHDAETQDPMKAADHLKAFRMYVRDGQDAMNRAHGTRARIGGNPAYVV